MDGACVCPFRSVGRTPTASNLGQGVVCACGMCEKPTTDTTVHVKPTSVHNITKAGDCLLGSF